MHRLDNVINDVELRIKAICENSVSFEEPSLQESIVSYCWILLDSWIAWRTLRFLLKETEIDDKIHRKWYSTPSSYTASQIKAVWKFRDSADEFLEKHTGKNLKTIIDTRIQPKRNSSAHFSQDCNNKVKGSDINEIKQLHRYLRIIFLIYETNSFLNRVCDNLIKRDFEDFYIQYENPNNEQIEIGNFVDSIESFNGCKKKYQFFCSRKDSREYAIIFQENGCKAMAKNEENDDVINLPYKFWENKGYYLNINSFLTQLENCWKI